MALGCNNEHPNVALGTDVSMLWPGGSATAAKTQAGMSDCVAAHAHIGGGDELRCYDSLTLTGRVAAAHCLRTSDAFSLSGHAGWPHQKAALTVNQQAP